MYNMEILEDEKAEKPLIFLPNSIGFLATVFPMNEVYFDLFVQSVNAEISRSETESSKHNSSIGKIAPNSLSRMGNSLNLVDNRRVENPSKS